MATANGSEKRALPKMEEVIDESMNLDTASAVSETSAAVVSLYNSWSSSSERDAGDDSSSSADTPACVASGLKAALSSSEHHSVSLTPRSSMSSACSGVTQSPLQSSDYLLRQLRKRCREEDIPRVPILRQRTRPVCRFLNYRGTRPYDQVAIGRDQVSAEEEMIMQVATVDFHHTGLFAFGEKDALFPFVTTTGSKAKHRSDDEGDARCQDGAAAKTKRRRE